MVMVINERVPESGPVKPDTFFFALSALSVFPVTTRTLEDLSANFNREQTPSTLRYNGDTPGERTRKM